MLHIKYYAYQIMAVEMSKLERLLQLQFKIAWSEVNDTIELTFEEKQEWSQLKKEFEQAEEFYWSDIGKRVSEIVNSFMYLQRNQITESDRMKIQWFDERMTIGENKTIYYKPARNLAEVEKNEKKISEIMELFKNFEWTYEKAYYAMKEIARIIYN